MALKRAWYKKWFGNEYLIVYAHRDEKEALQLINLIHSNIKLSPKSKILDLCCGQGRHALILAKQGYRVYGVDLSSTLLTHAKFRSNKQEKAHFIQADMRYLPARESFDLLLNLFTSFGYFAMDEENIAVFNQFKAVLKNNSYFIFDYFNSSHVVENLVKYQQEKLGKLLVEQERHIDNDRVQKKIILSKNGHKSIFYESVKLYKSDQILSMLEKAGLVVNKIFGDYDGSVFNRYSPRYIIIGQKK
jgi:ubiquinone/menaquinone biosynthesis C-methylase UbiE